MFGLLPGYTIVFAKCHFYHCDVPN